MRRSTGSTPYRYGSEPGSALGSEATRPAPVTALVGGVVEMHMQPIVDLVSGRPVVFEALARLRRPDGTLATAAQFVPGLDNDGLDSLFVIALDRTLASLAHWNSRGIHVDVSVNLDPSSLANPGCSEWIDAALRLHSIEPARLIIELLETGPIDTVAQIAAIDRIGELGVRIAIDDLGSGHSTLARLGQFDFDLIKIDVSAHSDFALAPESTLSTLLRLITVSDELHRPSVVEGLEDLDMVGVAAVLGAPLGQGHVIACPMPAAEVPAWTATAGPLVDLDHLATFAAALAYHWLHGTHPGPVGSCPITRLLAEHGDGAPVQLWHAAQHGEARTESAAFGSMLTAWLTAQITHPSGAV